MKSRQWVNGRDLRRIARRRDTVTLRSPQTQSCAAECNAALSDDLMQTAHGNERTISSILGTATTLILSLMRSSCFGTTSRTPFGRCATSFDGRLLTSSRNLMIASTAAPYQQPRWRGGMLRWGKPAFRLGRLVATRFDRFAGHFGAPLHRPSDAVREAS
jgi:hypothetical protein